MPNQFLKLRRSSVPGKIPDTASLDFGEIALNTYDGLAFMKKSGSNGEQIVTIGSTSGSFTGSLEGTSSWAINAITASYALNAGSGGNITGSSYYLAIFSGSNNLESSTIFQSASFTAIRNSTGPEDPNNPDILYVNGEGIDTHNIVSAHSDRNGYIQTNVQNYNNSTEASSDVVATADNGNESINYIDMGINSSGYTNVGNVGGQNDAYVYSTGNDLYIGNATPNRKIILFNGGLDAVNQSRVFIHDQGTVGINTISYNAVNPPSLQVEALNDATYNIIQAAGETDNYLQVAITNRSGGPTASADLVLYNNIDPTNQLAGFIDIGINSTNYVYNGVYPGSAGDGYVFTDSQHLLLGATSGSVNTKVTIFAGGISELENSKLILRGNNQHEMTGSFSISGSLANGAGVIAIGSFSHAEGAYSQTGTDKAYHAISVVNGLLVLSSSYGDVSSHFAANNLLYLYDAYADDEYGKTEFVISSSIYDAPNTKIQLVDISVSTSEAYVGDLGYDLGLISWQGDKTIPNLYSHAEGYSNATLGDRSHAEGIYTQAIGDNSHAEGASTIATKNTAHSEGSLTKALGDSSHAEGYHSIASGGGSHAEGYYTIASGDYSHTEGDSTRGLGIYSHAEGRFTVAIGGGTHAEGYYTSASGESSHAEGINTIALGSYSHAEGGVTIASSSYSHAEGRNSIAAGETSHAEGEETIARGVAAHSEGQTTQATGNYSHAEGGSTQAIGNYSHTEGIGTIASGDYQHAQGTYNITSSAQGAFIVGNGASNANRSNLIFAAGSTVQITGSLQVSGSITGSLFGTSSWAQNASTASYIINAVSASYLSGSTAIVDTLTSSFNALISGVPFGVGNGGLTSNVGIGINALSQSTSNPVYGQNVAIGSSTLKKVTTGNRNVAVGFNAMNEVITGFSNVAVGRQALANNTSNYNVGIGDTAIGLQVTGQANTGIGALTGQNLVTGSFNVLVGYRAGAGIVSGSNNTIVGSNVIGLPSGLDNNIILADGAGNIKYRWDTVQNNIYGNLATTGSVTATTGFTGSLFGTASWALNTLTASYADNFTVAGTLTAQTIVVQTITASVEFVTGSTKFGSLLSNTHQFTGSVNITGSLAVNNSSVILTNQTASMSVATASYVLNAVSASYAATAALAPLYVLTSATSSMIVLSSSFASTASAGNSSFDIGISEFNTTSSITSAGTTVVSSIVTGSFTSAFYNYTIASASNARSGQVMSVWNGTTIRYTEVTTTDIGNTATASFAVSLSGANVRLNFTAPGSWTVKSIANLL